MGLVNKICSFHVCIRFCIIFRLHSLYIYILRGKVKEFLYIFPIFFSSSGRAYVTAYRNGRGESECEGFFSPSLCRRSKIGSDRFFRGGNFPETDVEIEDGPWKCHVFYFRLRSYDLRRFQNIVIFFFRKTFWRNGVCGYEGSGKKFYFSP